MRPLIVAGTVAGTLVAVGAATLGLSAARWNRETRRVVARLTPPAGRAALPADTTLAASEAAVPAPVARYLALAMPPDAPRPSTALVRQEGTFLVKPGSWAPFTAVTRVAADPPGFVWDASIRMAPGVTTRVRDSYVAGEGTMHGAVAALVTVVHQAGTPAMAEASLQRWMAEAPWLPPALLPRRGVAWSSLDDSTARLTVTDAGVRATIDVHFAPTGEIARVTAERWRDVEGTPVRTPWEGRWSEYATVAGMRIPRRGEVAWMVDGDWQPYWHGRLVGAEYTR